MTSVTTTFPTDEADFDTYANFTAYGGVSGYGSNRTGRVQGGEYRGDVGTSDDQGAFETSVYTDDQAATVTIGDVGGGADRVGVLLRCSAAVSGFVIRHENNTTFQCYYITSNTGGRSVIGSGFAQVLATTDDFTVKVTGAGTSKEISLYINTGGVITGTPDKVWSSGDIGSNGPDSGSPGPYMVDSSNTGSQWGMSEWTGFDVTGGADVTAPTITPPSIIDAAGTSLTLAADETINVGTGGNGGLALSTGETLAYVSGDGSSSVVYSISPAVESGDTPTLAYTQPTDGWEDDAGNDLATFSGAAITNNSTVAATASFTTVSNFINNTNTGPQLNVAVVWNWYPGGRIGSLLGITPIEGTGTTNATTGLLTVTGLAAGAGLLLVAKQVTDATDDEIFYEAGTAA